MSTDGRLGSPARWRKPFWALAPLCASLIACPPAIAEDWPALGLSATRNAVSPESGPPLSWDVPTGKNIRWTAELGSSTFGDPVVADGLVWVGTNNTPLDEPGGLDAGVLACFRERDGRPLYRYVCPRSPLGRIHDWPYAPIACSPLIEGDRLWFTTNRGEVVCLDIGPLKHARDQENPAPVAELPVVWKVDLMTQHKVFFRGVPMHLVHTCSLAGHGDYVYCITGNGVDETYSRVPVPTAPSLVCLNKQTGELVWSDASPGEHILEGQWSSPLVMEIGGCVQVIVPQGDGWLRSFDATSGAPLWQFDINYKKSQWTVGGRPDRNHLLAAPVYYEGRIYIASGAHPERGQGIGRLCCIDPSRRGDISSELAVDAAGAPLPRRRLQAVDPTKGEQAVANPNSGLVWEFVQKSDQFEDQMHQSVTQVAVHDGLVIAGDYAGMVHCLDAASGEHYWSHDLLRTNTASPLIVDGKVFLVDDDGEVCILELSKIRNVLADFPVEPDAYSAGTSPIFANGVLYIATRNKLYAIAPAAAAEVVLPAAAGEPSAARPRTGVDRGPDAIFVPTPEEAVAAMLELAQVRKEDLVYDLGSGDGRVLIAAARKAGCKAVGIEIDAELVALSRKRIDEAGLGDLVSIEHADLFTTDLSAADVVALYLPSRLLERLRPQLEKLKPGSRIVSHHFPIPGVRPERTEQVESAENSDKHRLYLYTAPLIAEESAQ